MGNFAHVQSYVLKAEATSDVPDKNVVTAKLKCATGLEQLDAGKFKRAAKCFVEVAFELGNNYNEVISANDVATYGGLCALASFDRSELKSKIIDNSEFKQFLELEPQIREIIYSFYQSKYTVCLEALERIKVGSFHSVLRLSKNSHTDFRRRATSCWICTCTTTSKASTKASGKRPWFSISALSCRLTCTRWRNLSTPR